MPLSQDLEKKLAKPFPPQSRIDDSFRGNDLTIITDENGDAISLFIGKRNPDGSIRGERYSRKLVREAGTGRLLKSHWDLKGKVSRG